MAKRQVTVVHDFYCMNCGHKSISLARKRGKLHSKFHRKKMYCPYCGNVVNHIEVRNELEEYEIKEMIENGDYVEEAQESMEFIEQESKK